MRWILSAAAALLVSVAAAQGPQPPAGGPPLPPRYEVEVLIFAHRTFDPAEERFDYAPSGLDADLPLREAPVFDDTLFSSPLGEPPAPPPQADPPAPEPLTPEPPSSEQLAAEQRAAALLVVPLRPEELKLATQYRQLRNLAAYEPLG